MGSSSRSRRRHVLRGLLLLLLLLVSMPLPALPPEARPALPAPLAELAAPPAAQAQGAASGNFGIAPNSCLNATNTFATTCFADTIWQRERLGINEEAVISFNNLNATGQKSELTKLARIGSVYGLAYDDGIVSGRQRLFAAAYAKRYTAFGPQGPGGIYEIQIGTSAITVSDWLAIVPEPQPDGTTWPGANACATQGHDCHGDVVSSTQTLIDYRIARWLGRTSLGDMEIAPNGRMLYVTNLAARTIERIGIAGADEGVRQAPLVIDFNGLFGDRPVALASGDLRPFALEFRPSTNLLYVGIIDAGTRGQISPNTQPTAYVVEIDTVTGAQRRVLEQELRTGIIGSRFANAGPERLRDDVNWSPWSESRNGWNLSPLVRPQPMLADIQFSLDGTQMLLGFRDRVSDMYLGAFAPADEPVAQAQGDLLVYHASGGGWALQTTAEGPVSTDYFNDNYVGSEAGDTARVNHPENMQGALALALTRRANDSSFAGLEQRLVATVITPQQGGTSGAAWHMMRPYTRPRQSSVELISPGDPGDGKVAGLGDLELLCTYAFVGNQVWRDVDGDGVQDAGEPGIGNVAVELLDANGVYLSRATTNATGHFAFAVQPNTTYMLQLADANFQPGGPLAGLYLAPQNMGGGEVAGSAADAVDSDADEITRRITVNGQGRDALNTALDFGLIEAIRLYGQVGDLVWGDSNGNGRQDAGESGVTVGAGQQLASLSVDLLRCNDLGTTCASTSVLESRTLPQAAQGQGRYRFVQIPPGFYRVRFSVPPGMEATTRRAAGVQPSQDSDASGTVPPAWTSDPFCLVSGINPLRPACAQQNVDIDLGLVLNADVSISKSGPAATPRGDAIVYTLSWRNDGPGQAQNVTVVDSLPPGITPQSSTPPWTNWSGQQLLWNLGTLGGGAAGTITINAVVNADAPSVAVNVASINTTTSDPNPSNNTSQVTTEIQRPGVYITKSGPPAALVGDTLTYALGYGNLIAARPGETSEARNTSIQDVLPAGVTFLSATPPPTSISGRTLTWSVGTLAAGTTRSISIQARVDTSFTGASLTNEASIITIAPPGDDPADNTTSFTTALRRPAISISLSTPASVVLGNPMPLTLVWRNTGSAPADNTTITVNVPQGLTPIPGSASLPWSSWNAATRQLTWNLGTQPAGESGIIGIELATDETAPATLNFLALITTTTPGELDTSDNVASSTTQVLRPNVYVQLSQPTQPLGYLFEFITSVSYGNNGTAAAANSTLTVTLPSGLSYVGMIGADTPPSWRSGQVLVWNLGTLAPGATGSLRIETAVDAGAGASLTTSAAIGTTSRGDNPADNSAQASVTVLPPPPPAEAQASDMLLAIHSDLDPNSQDASAANAVYTTNSRRLSWPAGEVLDFTPRLTPLARGALVGPYDFEAQAQGWSVVSYNVEGRSFAVGAADSMHGQGGRSGLGCRTRTLPTGRDGAGLPCATAYIGGASLSDPTQPNEADMAGQAHAYWTVVLPQRMRNDVNVYQLREIGPVSFDVMVKVRVERWVNAQVINPDGSAGTERRQYGPPIDDFPTATFTVDLVVPRSIR